MLLCEWTRLIPVPPGTPGEHESGSERPAGTECRLSVRPATCHPAFDESQARFFPVMV